jgi:hypothetical protein
VKKTVKIPIMENWRIPSLTLEIEKLNSQEKNIFLEKKVDFCFLSSKTDHFFAQNFIWLHQPFLFFKLWV